MAVLLSVASHRSNCTATINAMLADGLKKTAAIKNVALNVRIMMLHFVSARISQCC